MCLQTRQGRDAAEVRLVGSRRGSSNMRLEYFREITTKTSQLQSLKLDPNTQQANSRAPAVVILAVFDSSRTIIPYYFGVTHTL